MSKRTLFLGSKAIITNQIAIFHVALPYENSIGAHAPNFI